MARSVPNRSWKREMVVGASSCSVIASCEPGPSWRTESSRSTTRSLASAWVRSWSPSSTGAFSPSGVQALAPACSTSACPSIASTTPTCSWADARLAPRTETSARRSSSRRSVAWGMSVREAQLRLDDVTIVLEDGDIGGIEGPVVAERDGEVGRDRALHCSGPLVDVVLAPFLVGGEGVRLGVVLVAEHVHELDARLPPGREADPGVDLVVAIAVVASEGGARPRPLATPLVAQRRRAGAPVDRLAEAHRVRRTVADVLERRAQVGDLAVAVEELREPPAALGQRDEGRDERLARVSAAAERVALVADLRPHPQLRKQGVAGRSLDPVREQVEVLQPEMQVLIEVVLETDLRAIALQHVEAPAGTDRDRTVGGIGDRSRDGLAARIERDVRVVEQAGRDVHLPAPRGRRAAVGALLGPGGQRDDQEHRADQRAETASHPGGRLAYEQDVDLLNAWRQDTNHGESTLSNFARIDVCPVRLGAKLDHEGAAGRERRLGRPRVARENRLVRHGAGRTGPARPASVRSAPRR